MGSRLFLALIFSISVIFIDVRFNQLDPVRNVISTALSPVQWFSGVPSEMFDGLDRLVTRQESIDDEVDMMRARMLVLERKAQKLASVSAELNRLRELLNASRVVDEGVVVAELLAASQNPDNQYIMINKGLDDGVYHGQAVLDSRGLMGQVIEANQFTSRILLISDSRHAVPVQVNRNGVRAIAYGVGSLSHLELDNVPDTADILVGDLLVSSGLGGRFPRGYPVARVSEIVHDPGQPFARVKVTPEAQLNRSRLLLLVFKENSRRSEPDVGETINQGEMEVIPDLTEAVVQ